MTTRTPRRKATSPAAAHATDRSNHAITDEAPPSPLDALRHELVTLDALAFYVVTNLEHATSDDPTARRRFGRLVGLLADHAAGACESAGQGC